MTRQQARALVSKVRSAEYQRKRKMNMVFLFVSLFVWVVVPAMWYGAIEYGWIRPIQTPEFKTAVQMLGAMSTLVFLQFAWKYLEYQDDDRKLKKLEESGEEVSA